MFDKIVQYFKSWTIKFGLLLELMSMVQIYFDDIGNPFATMVVGLIIIGLRFKTIEALADK